MFPDRLIRLTRRRLGTDALPWLHAILLLLVFAAFLLVWNGWRPSLTLESTGFLHRLRFSLGALPGSLFALLPPIAAISVWLSGRKAGTARTSLWLAVLVSLAMVSIDLFAPRGSVPVFSQPALFSGSEGMVIRESGAEITGRGLPSLVEYLRGDDPQIEEIRNRYPPGHARLAVAQGFFALFLMLVPPGLVGLSLGVCSWIRSRVSFRSPRDERIAFIFLGWVFVPAAYALLISTSLDAQIGVLFRGGSPFLILLPALPLLLAGAIGWRAAFRADQDGGKAEARSKTRSA